MYEMIPIFLCVALVAVWIKPLGGYMAAVYLGLPHPLSRVLGGFESRLYRLCGIHPERGMSWRSYSFCVLAFGGFGGLLLFAIFTLQDLLPLNPEGMSGLPAHAAFNAAISFVTNTNWQSYSGEAQLSYFSQTVAIAVQMFLSAATGLAVAVALCRSLAVRQAHTIGNFWVDMVRSVLYILLPMSVVFGIILVSQGVVQNYAPYTAITTLEGASATLAGGPAALQTAIKMLGSNGGGFFATNSAHPFENPNAITNLLQLASILLLPATFIYTAGLIMRDRRQGIMMLAAMVIMFMPFTALIMTQEYNVSPRYDANIIDVSEGNMEGKETRFGILSSALWAASTTATSNGSANSAHDSYAPLSGMAMMMLMQFGEVIFGGVGSGVYGMLTFVLMATFMAGLMVGRTPEFLGKKLNPFDIKMTAVILLIPAFLTLGGVSLAVVTEAGRTAITNPGSHGFSQILYAFTSASNNNGSAFAGLQAGSPFYNIALGICMLIGRYGVIIATLALAGSFASKNTTPVSAGTLPTHTPLFAVMLVMVIFVLGVLTYVPALALGPIVEHLTVMVPQ
ncbi:MAG: potassium-transporting ATPase subunit KdpA [Alphaproteobacteria bacterium]|nr:potassium-transporting ATPase subunit KdpA [Alphaproteobacteria bacterium]